MPAARLPDGCFQSPRHLSLPIWPPTPRPCSSTGPEALNVQALLRLLPPAFLLCFIREGSGISRPSEPEASFWKENKLAAHSGPDLWRVHKETETSPQPAVGSQSLLWGWIRGKSGQPSTEESVGGGRVLPSPAGTAKALKRPPPQSPENATQTPPALKVPAHQANSDPRGSQEPAKFHFLDAS